LSIIFLLFPQILSVRKSIVDLTSAKSVNFLFGTSSNFAQGTIYSFTWFRRSSRGLLVTTPSPLGKKSRPTIDSKTDDFPADYPPSIAILGSLIYCYNPTSLNSSYNIWFNIMFLTKAYIKL
jgi:hypothetical protein